MRARIPASSGLFALNREISVCVRLRGGGRSRYRTGLTGPNSLLTGKITGNFDNFGPVGEIPGKICEATRELRTNSLINGTGNFYEVTGNFYEVTGKAFAGYRELPVHFVN
jgi:hypothetical protein